MKIDPQSLLNEEIMGWLLDESDPSIRYFALRWLLEKPTDDPDVVAASQAIAESEPIQKILKRQKPAGYWGSDSRPHHGTRGTLLLLMWLGYQGNGSLSRAMEYRINGCLQENGAYGIELKGRTVLLPCHGADLLRLMVWYGYQEDPRTRKLLEWLVDIQDQDGVWPCISKLRPFSCMWATAVALRAFRDLPVALRSARVEKSRRQAVDRFLNSGLYRYGRGKPSPRWFIFGFPLQFDSDILEVLDLVAPYVAPDDERIQEGLDLVLGKRDADGRWRCEKQPKGGRWMQQFVELEEIGQPSKWVTLHALKMLKTLYSESRC